MTWLYAGVMVVVTPAVIAVTEATAVLIMFCTCVSQSVGRATRQNAPVSSKVVHSFCLSDIVKTLQPSGETNAREDGNVQGRRDQIFAAAHC